MYTIMYVVHKKKLESEAVCHYIGPGPQAGRVLGADFFMISSGRMNK